MDEVREYAVSGARETRDRNTGGVTEIAGLYILLAAGTSLSPAEFRIAKYKRWMRSVLVLWWVVLLWEWRPTRVGMSPSIYEMNSWIDSKERGLKVFAVSLFLMLCGLAQPSCAQSGTTSQPDPNPGRPTVSTPATLTPVGYLQFENGTLFANHSTEFSNRLGFSQVTKLTVLPRLELFLQTEPLVTSQIQSQTAVHEGEVFAGMQGVLFSGGESKPTVSVSYIRRLHASVAPELDIGTFRQSGSILVSGDLHGFHLDTNGIITEQIQGEIHRAQFGQTLSLSHPIGRFTISAEVWHFSQPFERSDAVGNLWALSYALRKNLVVDGGFDHGLTKTSTRWEIFLGFTYLLPHRLWMDHKRQR